MRADLQWVLDDRALLLDQRNEESDYEQSLQLQAGRLTSLDLIGFTSGNGTADVPACPACGQPTDEADPTPAALRSSLNRLRGQLENLAADRPSQRNALQALEAQATAFREGLASAEAALNALQGADRFTNLTAADSRDFTRGGIDAILARVESVDEGELRRLRASADSDAATGPVPGRHGKTRCPFRPASLTLDRDRPEILTPPERASVTPGRLGWSRPPTCTVWPDCAGRGSAGSS